MDSVYDTQVLPVWVAPFGYLRIYVCLPLPAAFRSLPRPSSAPGAKAFPLRPFLLNLFFGHYVGSLTLRSLSFFSLHKIVVFLPRFRKTSSDFHTFFVLLCCFCASYALFSFQGTSLGLQRFTPYPYGGLK